MIAGDGRQGDKTVLNYGIMGRWKQEENLNSHQHSVICCSDRGDGCSLFSLMPLMLMLMSMSMLLFVVSEMFEKNGERAFDWMSLPLLPGSSE